MTTANDKERTNEMVENQTQKTLCAAKDNVSIY